MPAETKQEMTALDLRFMVKELRKQLSGGVCRKIYQYGKAGSRQFLFEFWMPGKGSCWLYVDSGKIFITNRKKAAPQEPPTFCMFLRKHFMGKKIKAIKQYEFDRIIEIANDDNILIIELFSTGNLILTDTMYNIIMPLEFQKWKGREVKPKVAYKYPPRLTNPFSVDFDSLRRAMSKSDKNVGMFLATVLSMGSDYSGEILARAGVSPERLCKELAIKEASAIHDVIAALDKEDVRPSVYPGFVSPFPLKTKGQPQKSFESISQAFDEFFSGQEISQVKEEAVSRASEEKEKFERIVSQQDRAKEKWERIIKESQEKGNLIYNNYPTVQSAIEGINKAKASGMSWSEIKETISNEQTPEAEAIKEIRQGDGIVVLDLGGTEIEIEFNKSVEENAARYFEDSKWGKRKLEGLGQVKGEFSDKLESASQKEEKVLGEDFTKLVFPKEKKGSEKEVSDKSEEGMDSLSKVPGLEKPQPEQKKRWFESFRWFFSSDGFLVVAGKSAESNEALLKKHTDPKDVVFHADIPGAAFVVIKAQGLDVTDTTKREAAEFAAANSKAWARGLGTIDIFSVPRERVSKTPPSGQYLPKGSFMVSGQRDWYRNLELKLAIGIKVDRKAGTAKVVSGPLMAVRKHSDYFVTLKPGYKKSLEVSRIVKNKVLIKARHEDRFILEQVPLEEIQVLVPSGMADVVEHAGEAV